VHADHLRLAAQQLFQGPKLRFAADERDAAPLGDRRGDDRSINRARPPVQGRMQTRSNDPDRQPALHLYLSLIAGVLRNRGYRQLP
jgi:hypothetical protein